jgi:hypothetical protein
MKNVRYQLLLLAMAAALAWPLSSFASGTYTSRLPQPPSKAGKGASIDRAKYDLGQRVFNAKTVIAAQGGDAAAQRTRLQAIQNRLPEKVAKKKDLTALAGKLTEEQLDALDYFVKERYPVSK